MRVLVLENSASQAEQTMLELRGRGLELEWEMVQTEPEYLTGLEKAPDIVLADYNVPEFDAPRALRLLNQRELDIPFIVLGDELGLEEAVECLQLGAADVLLKERLGGLGQAVRQALEARRLRRDKAEAESAQREQTDALRRSEEHWRHLVVDLQERFEAANASLEAAEARVAQLHRLKREIASTISHELRAPLSNIRLYLDLLESGKPEKRAHYMATLRHEVRFMGNLIEDILHLARLEMGDASLVLQPVDAGQVLADVVDAGGQVQGRYGRLPRSVGRPPCPELGDDYQSRGIRVQHCRMMWLVTCGP